MSQPVTELTVYVANDERKKHSKAFLVYEQFSMNPNDPIIKDAVKELLDEFKGDIDSIKIKATMVLQ
jgi:Mrp family chromosome partitioning ATPase